MLTQKHRTTYVNIVLSLAVIILSLYTVYWHNKNYQLYKIMKTINKENQKIMALHRQLRNEYSAQTSGKIITEKVLKELKMQKVKKTRILQL